MTDNGIECLVLPKRLRFDFAVPRGNIVSGKQFVDMLRTTKCKGIASVGDVVTEYLLSEGVIPALAIVDMHTRREVKVRAIEEYEKLFDEVLYLYNPPGSIVVKSVEVICRKILEGKRTLVVVNGEEDMLALPAIACAPDGFCVVYGVPGIGAAVIKVGASERYNASSRLLVLERGVC